MKKLLRYVALLPDNNLLDYSFNPGAVSLNGSDVVQQDGGGLHPLNPLNPLNPVNPVNPLDQLFPGMGAHFNGVSSSSSLNPDARINISSGGSSGGGGYYATTLHIQENSHAVGGASRGHEDGQMPRASSGDAAAKPHTPPFALAPADSNPAPVTHIPGTVLRITEDAAVKTIHGISVSVADANSEITVHLSVAHGTLAVSTTLSSRLTDAGITGLTNAGIQGQGTGTLTLTGTATAINATLTTLSYTVTPNFSGSDTLSVSSSVGGSPALSSSGTMAIDVAAVNDAPTLAGIPDSAPLIFVSVAADLVNFSANDADGANTTLYVTLVPTGGSIGGFTDSSANGLTTHLEGGTVHLTGTAAAINAALAAASFTASAAGTASIAVRVSDVSLTDTSPATSSTRSYSFNADRVPLLSIPNGQDAYINATETGIDVELAFDGLAQNGTVQIRVDGTLLPTTYTATASDASSHKITLNIARADLGSDGPKTITADLTQNGTSTTSARLTLTLDTTAPDAPTLAVGAGVSGGATAAEATQSSGAVTVTAESGSTVLVTFTDSASPTANSVVKTATGTGAAIGVTLDSADLGTGAAKLLDGTITVSATATDVAGNVSTAGTGTFTLDTVAPTLTTISSDKSTLKKGETATITFTFSEDPDSSFSWDGSMGDVSVTGGTLGALSGSGTTRTATFTPTDDLNAGSASISVASGTFTDAAGNPGTGASASTINFDTGAPAAPSLAPDAAVSGGATAAEATAASGVVTVNAESGSTVRVTFTDSDSPAHSVVKTVTGTGAAIGVTLASTDLGTGAAKLLDGTITVSAVATDAAGNASTAGTGTFTLDTVAPTLAITSSVSAVKVGETATITFTFSEEPTGFDSSDIVVTGGTLGTLSGNGTTRTATFTPTANIDSTTASITVAANGYTDAAGNSGGAGTTPMLTVDTTAPTLAITSSVSAVKAGETATITFTFSEAPTGFDSSDIVVTGGTLGTLTGSGTTRTATFTPTANTDSTTASITVAANGYTDAAGNNGGAGTTPMLTVDTKAPTLAITSSVSAVKVGETATITFTFSEAPTDFDGSDIVTTGGTLGTLTGNGTTRTATFTPTANTDSTTASITVAANGYTDAAGNSGGAGTTPMLTVDTTAPTLVITSSATAVKAGETATITFTFSEAPTDFDSSDIVVTGGTLGTLSGTGTTRTATFTPTPGIDSTTASITVAANGYTDAAGNNGGAGTTPTLIVDTTAPTLVITSSATAVKASETATITFTFSETPTGFDSSDITVTGGTLGTLSGNGTTRTATFTPTANTDSTTASITVAANGYTDAAGNNGGAGSTPTLTVDTKAPTLAITSSVSTVKVGETATITFTFSEAPTGFDSSDITVTGGTLGTLSGSGTTRTATFTPTANIDSTAASITVAANGYTDAAGNNGGAGTTPTLTVDTTAPTLAITSSATAVKAGETATITFTFSEAPTGFDSSDITVTGGTLGTLSGSGTTRTATFTPTANIDSTTASITVAANGYTDAAGNNGGAGTTPTLTVDTKAPTLAITSSVSAVKAGETATITFTFSEAPTGFDSSDIVVTGGTLGTLTGNGTTRTATFTPTPGIDSTTASITVAANGYTDAAGNNGGAGTTPMLTVDTTAPTLAITSSATAVKAGETATITFTFSEAPTGFDSSDITVTGGTLGTLSGSGTTRTATFTPTANIDSTAASITVAVNGYTDAAGNNGGAGTTPTLTVDTKAPTLAITSSVSAVKAGETATITFTFSEAPTGFDSSDIVVTGGTLGTLTGNGTTRTATFTPTANIDSTTASITVAANGYTDAAGNNGGAGTTPMLTVDTKAPTLAITSSVSAVKAGETATITFTFSEAPTGFDSSDIVVTGGTLGTLSGSGTTRTATFTPTANIDSTTASITVAANGYTDAAGNNGGAGTTPTLTVDTKAPTLAITSSVSAVKAGETATITFTFSEAPTGFDSSDIVVTGGTLGTLTGNGTTRTATFTPTANIDSTAASITVAANGYTDAAGNNGGAGTTPMLTVDTKAPILTSASLQGTSTITLTFDTALDSAAFTGITTADLNNLFSFKTAAIGDTYDTVDDAFTAISVSGSTVTLTLSNSAYTSGHLAQISYTDPANDQSTGVVQDAGGNDLVSFTDTAVITTPIILGFAVSDTVSSNGTALGKAGEAVTVAVSFSADVTLTASKTYTVSVQVGSNPSEFFNATLETGSGTQTAGSSYNFTGTLPSTTGLSTSNLQLTDLTFPASASIVAGSQSLTQKTYALASTAYTVDSLAPTVSSIALVAKDEKSGQSYAVLNTGDTVDVAVTFSEAVTITGSPTVTLNVGGVNRTATFDSNINGTTSSKKFFRYTVAAGDTDANGISIAANALALNGGSITDTAGNTATITHAQVADNSTYSIDTTTPVFSSGATATAIAENSAAGQLVYTAVATDSATLSYSLKAGTGDVAAFSINSSTGAVTLTGSPNFETKPSYSFTVIATDAAGNASEQAVTLAVTNVDETAPTFSSGATATAIAENSGAGQVVYTAAAADTDFIAPNTASSVSYSLKVGNDASAFTINSSTGAVTLTASPNFETKPGYSFTVIATDAAGNAREQEVTLAVTNVNEAPVNTVPAIALAAITATALPISGISVSDVDAGSNGVASVQLSVAHGTVSVSSTASGGLVAGSAISGSGTATLTLTGSQSAINATLATLSYTSTAGHTGADTLTVLTTDGGTPALTDSDTVSINVTAAADTTPPTVSSIALVAKDEKSGQSYAVLNTGDTVDVAVTFSEAVTITGSPTVTLNVGGVNRTATFDSNINGTTSSKKFFRYTVVASDTDANGISIAANALALNGGSITDTAGNTATITHAQVADNSTYSIDTTTPVFSSGATATAIAENSAAGQLVYTAVATDSATLSYSLKVGTGDVAAFSINSSTGAVTLTGSPNFETKPSYSFTVIATDAAGNASEQAVTLAVTNVDETAPTFSSGATATAIPENSAAGSVVYTAAATDTDFIAPNTASSVSYSLKAGNDASAFTINSSTGAVTLTASPNFETKPGYSFTVIATDAAGNAREQEVTLAVTNVNEAPVNTVPASALAAITATALTISGISVSDVDAGSNGVASVQLSVAHGTVSVSSTASGGLVAGSAISGSGTATLTLTGSQSAINATLATLSYTSTAGHTGADTLTVLTTDGGTPAMTDSDTVSINVTAAADTTPPTVSSIALVAKDEKSGQSYAVLNTGDTVDVAVTFSEAVTITGSPTVTLNVGGVNRTATFDSNINGTTSSKKFFRYTVVASDTDANGISIAANALALNGGSITDTAGNTATITHAQVADNSTYSIDTTTPVFSSGATATAIAENSAAGQLVYTAVATDSATLSYSLKAGTGDVAAFTINSSTGAVTLTASPNFETKPSYSFTVIATDAAGNASEQAVTLAVTNVDEVAPTFSSGATATAIPENSAAGSVVYTAAATDTDFIAPNTASSVSYSLKVGNDASAFTINSSTGAVTLTASPNFETKPSYSFTVIATDAAGNAREQEVTLAVTNVNEAPVNTVPASALAAITATALTISGISVSDVDAGSNGVASVQLSVAHGTVSVSSTASGGLVAGSAISGSGTATLTLTGSQSAINATLATLSYTSTAGHTGADTLTVLTTDGGTPALTDSDTVSINVVAVGTTPVVSSFVVSDAGNSNGANLGKGGETVRVAVSFSEAVTLTASSTYTVHVQIGSNASDGFDAFLDTTSLSGSASLYTFTGTLPSSNTNLVTSALQLTTLSGPSIRNASNTVLTQSSYSLSSNAYTVDTAAPVIAASPSLALKTSDGTAATGDIGAGGQAVLTIDLGEAATNLTGLPTLDNSTIIKVNGTGKSAAWTTSGNNLVLTYTAGSSDNGAITVDAAALKTALAGITDSAGNAAMIGGSTWATGSFTAPTTSRVVDSAKPVLDLNGAADGVNNVLASNIGNSATAINLSGGPAGGAAPYIDLPDVLLGGDLTLEAWVNFSAMRDGQRVFDIGNGNSNNNLILLVNANGATTSSIRVGGTAVDVPSPAGNPALVAGQWYHLALVVTSSTQKVFVNGVEWSSGGLPAGFSTNPALTRTNTWIGRSNFGEPNANMQIKDVRIYDDARTTGPGSELASDMSGTPVDPADTDLRLAYKFDGNLQSSLPNGQAATAMNFLTAETPQFLAPNATLSETGNVQSVQVTVSGVLDGASEKLSAGGSSIAADGSVASGTVTVAANGAMPASTWTWAYVAGAVTGTGTFTFTATAAGGVSSSAAQNLLRSLAYSDTATTPTAGSRGFSITATDVVGNTSTAVTATLNRALTSQIDLDNTSNGNNFSNPALNVSVVNTAQGSPIAPNAALLTSDTSVSRIQVRLDGAGLDLVNDKLVLNGTAAGGNPVTVALNVVSSSATDISIGGIGGLRYSYNSTSKLLIITATSGSIAAADVDDIVKALVFRNALVSPRTGVRTFQVSVVNMAGEGTSSTSTLTLVDNVVPVAPTLTLGSGVVNGATEAEATAATGVVLVNAESGSTVRVTFTDSLSPVNSITKTVTGTGSARAVTLDATDLGTGVGKLNDGTISVTAVATDVNGNASAAGQTSLKLDTQAPAQPGLAVKSGQDNTITSSEASIDIEVSYTDMVAGDVITLLVPLFVGFPPLSISTYTVTAADVAAGKATVNVLNSRLGPDGSKNITAEVTDAAGNTTISSADLPITVDNSAPGIVIKAGQDAYVNASETSIDLEVRSSSMAAGDTIQLKLGGSNLGALYTVLAADVTAGRVASINVLKTALGNTDGSKSITADYSHAGAAAVTSPALTLTLDTAVPSSLVLVVKSGEDATIIASETGVSLELTGSNIAEGDLVTLKNGNTILINAYPVTAADVTAGKVALTVPAAALGADGVKSLTAEVRDAAGNSGTSGTLSVTLDTQGPLLGLQPGSGADVFINSAEAAAVAGVSVSVTGVSVGDVITIKEGDRVLSGPTTLTAAMITAGTYSLTFARSLLSANDGVKTLSVFATDAAGNTGRANQLDLLVDTSNPDPLTVTTPVSLAENTVHVGTPLTLPSGASAWQIGGTDARFFMVDGNQLRFIAAPDADRPRGIPFNQLTNANAYSITLTAVDAAGNTANGAAAQAMTVNVTDVVTVNENAPVLNLQPGRSSGVSLAEASSGLGVLAVAAAANATVTVVFSRSGGGTVTKTLTQDANGAPTAVLLTAAELETLGDGSISVTSSAGAVAGQNTVTFTLETTAPTGVSLTVNPPSNSVFDTTTNTLTLTANFTGLADGDTLTLLENGVALKQTFTVSNGGSGTQTLTLPRYLLSLGDGVKTLTLVATDAAGNSTHPLRSP